MSNYIDDVEMLKEYKIIREAFDNIKLDILNKVQEKNLTNNRTNIFDDFFNILDFQILFINQISQTFRGIKEDVGYKEKIINNLIKINKDMCEKMILNYIDKLQRRNAVEKRNSNLIIAQKEILIEIKSNRKKNNLVKKNNNGKSQIQLDIDYVLSKNEDIINKIKKKAVIEYQKRIPKSSSALSLKSKKQIIPSPGIATGPTNLHSSQNLQNISYNYSTNSLQIYQKPKQMNQLSLNSRSMTPNNRKVVPRFETLQTNVNNNVSAITDRNHSTKKKRNELITNSNQTTFETKLLNKYHQILNDYNSQKTEEECLKETKIKYIESVNQNKKKLEQIKCKYEKKNKLL